VRLFVDASALVALIAPENDASQVARTLDQSEERLWSAMSKWEAVTALCRSHGYEWTIAQRAIDDLTTLKAFRMVEIGAEEAALALQASRHYGKGNHPARLNMGDCFAYACAKTNNARLLYKGDDFSKTDLA
jgi:ribonuclease VapC